MGVRCGLFTDLLSNCCNACTLACSVMINRDLLIQNVTILFFLAISFFSMRTHADEYPGVITYSALGYTGSSASGVCTMIPPSLFMSAAVIANGGHMRFQSPLTCIADNGAGGAISTFGINAITSCPSGGTKSGSMCLNAPACLSPEIRSSTSPYACFTPAECAWPESDNGSGVCQNNECPSGQNRNPLTNLCQEPPTCGSTQTYNIQTNTCELYPLNCPGHTHANAANDQCLPDAPNVCPAGQHDDGTYNCVADDALGCKSNQQGGYINGVYQCINKPNLDTAAQAAQAAHDAATAAGQAATTAADAAKAANDALAADPSNTVLQQAAAAANSAADAAKVAADAKAAEAAAAAADATNKYLNSIDQTLKGEQQRADSRQAGEPGASCSSPPSCTGDAIDCAILAASFQASCKADNPTQEQVDAAMGGTTDEGTGNETSLADLDDSGLGVSASCPAPRSVSVLSSTMTLDLTPFCDLAEIFGNLLLITASFISLRILVS